MTDNSCDSCKYYDISDYKCPITSIYERANNTNFMTNKDFCSKFETKKCNHTFSYREKIEKECRYCGEKQLPEPATYLNCVCINKITGEQIVLNAYDNKLNEYYHFANKFSVYDLLNDHYIFKDGKCLN